MSGTNSIRLAANFDASISRHSEKLYPQTDRNHAFLKIPLSPDGSRHTRQPSDTAEPQSCFPQSRSWFPPHRSHLPRQRSGLPNQRSENLRQRSGLPNQRSEHSEQGSEPLKQRICPKNAQNHRKPAFRTPSPLGWARDGVRAAMLSTLCAFMLKPSTKNSS